MCKDIEVIVSPCKSYCCVYDHYLPNIGGKQMLIVDFYCLSKKEMKIKHLYNKILTECERNPNIYFFNDPISRQMIYLINENHRKMEIYNMKGILVLDKVLENIFISTIEIINDEYFILQTYDDNNMYIHRNLCLIDKFLTIPLYLGVCFQTLPYTENMISNLVTSFDDVDIHLLCYTNKKIRYKSIIYEFDYFEQNIKDIL